MLEKKLEELGLVIICLFLTFAEWKFSAEVKIRQKQEKASKETDTHMEQLQASLEQLNADKKQLQDDLAAQKAAVQSEKGTPGHRLTAGARIKDSIKEA